MGKTDASKQFSPFIFNRFIWFMYKIIDIIFRSLTFSASSSVYSITIECSTTRHTPCMNDDKVRKWMCNERLYCWDCFRRVESSSWIESFFADMNVFSILAQMAWLHRTFPRWNMSNTRKSFFRCWSRCFTFEFHKCICHGTSGDPWKISDNISTAVLHSYGLSSRIWGVEESNVKYLRRPKHIRVRLAQGKLTFRVIDGSS